MKPWQIGNGKPLISPLVPWELIWKHGRWLAGMPRSETFSELWVSASKEVNDFMKVTGQLEGLLAR
jgi:hypothetical protein